MDVFYEIPSDAEVAGDVFDGSEVHEVEDVAFKGVGVGAPGLREGDGEPSVESAMGTSDTLCFEDGVGLSVSGGE